ncbi:unnamed protein product [Kuraishia capsulata CBS 1993]|uniref:ER membrane protein complex subunit 10 n=1 Tax=Kuraishia capsulata CBS 1993 TaxID=1382522 RepID=W6MJ32_9ASCO|nr:uncharacterized protein KUCA_T00000384001 [Kuraishia capsulata CBS 1993]CDK24422.1 unnamed protein product [Kuraishia capsulata CBS 1993]
MLLNLTFVTVLSLLASIVNGLAIATTESPALFISDGKSKYELGQLRFDQKWELTHTDAEFPSGKYCVGISGQECFNHKEVDYPLSQKVLLRLVNNTINSVTLIQIDEEGLQLEQREIRKGASPRLGTKKTPVESGKGQAASSNEEQPLVGEKSFIQKYWMYIVPVLLMIMLVGGDGKEH